MTMENKRLHVFISHHHKDDAHVDKLTKLLGSRGYDVRNSSIRAKPANQAKIDRGLVKRSRIERLLRMKISWAGKVIVLIGKDTHKRPWVDWEIKQAKTQNKDIIGVFERGGTEADIPPALKDYASELVAWNADSILAALEGTDKPFEGPGGAPGGALTSMPRSNC